MQLTEKDLLLVAEDLQEWVGKRLHNAPEIDKHLLSRLHENITRQNVDIVAAMLLLESYVPNERAEAVRSKKIKEREALLPTFNALLTKRNYKTRNSLINAVMDRGVQVSKSTLERYVKSWESENRVTFPTTGLILTEEEIINKYFEKGSSNS